MIIQRGYIYDRYGKLLVANQPSYDIMVIPKDIKELDTTEFCSLLNITKEDFLKKIAKAKIYSPRLPSVFLPQLNKLGVCCISRKAKKISRILYSKTFVVIIR
jgi:penicillin-binding protein 2